MYNIRIFDIETLLEYALFTFYNPADGSFREFSINKDKDEGYALIKYLQEPDFDYLVGFNSLNFDAQVIQYIINEYPHWKDLSNLEITKKIALFASDVIARTNGGLFPPFREESLTNKHIDLFKIHHYDNKNRRVSLKWLQFMMDWHNVEEMPIHHLKERLTDQEIELVRQYCQNDVLSTYKFYQYTIGDTKHPQYRGKNKIQDRLDIVSEGLLPPSAVNYSDSKIGDEINKHSYGRIEGIHSKELYNLKAGRKGTKSFTFGDAIPKYIKFETPEFQAFYKSIKNIKVALSGGAEDQEFPIIFRGTRYTVARGGIHSEEAHRIIIPREGEILRDADVGSQYPNAIRKRMLYPVHLGRSWNLIGVQNIEKRMLYKANSEDKNIPEDIQRKNKSLSEMYKLALNAGYFGKTLDATNWQYGPEVGYYCTIGNQFEILKLVEMLELQGIHCVSANTDGIVCLFESSKDELYYKICHEWEELVGNTKLGKLEYTDFSGLFQESVNHYVAVKKKDGSIKVKGRFDFEGELNKNNTDKISRIERKAFQDYFSKKIPVEQTIRECKDIYMFCIGKKTSSDYRWETLNLETHQFTKHKKLIRFYVSNDGERLLKIKNEGSLAPGAKMTRFYGTNLVTICNQIDESRDISTYNIDYKYYIDNIMEVVQKIDKNLSHVHTEKESPQLSLF